MLDGRTVIVSGVGAGLGQRIVRAAYRDGANVVLGARTESQLAAIAEAVDPDGERVAWRRTDISDPDQAAGLVGLALERFSGVDAVVNVAALDSLFGGLDGADFGAWRATLEVNLFGSMQVTQAALPALRKQGGGSVVFVGSQTMLLPPPEAIQMGYAASKGALLAAARHLAREVGKDGIRVNTVVAGWMWGPPVQWYVDATAKAQGVSAEKVLAGITKDMALDHMPSDADVAEAVVFLASDRARAITGQSLLVNAGEVMR